MKALTRMRLEAILLQLKTGSQPLLSRGEVAEFIAMIEARLAADERRKEATAPRRPK